MTTAKILSSTPSNTVTLTEADKLKARDYFKALLSMGISTLIFKKANGDIRTMHATRDEAITGENLEESLKHPPRNGDGSLRAETVSAVHVFDTELRAWRSFNIESLIALNGINIEVILRKANVNI